MANSSIGLRGVKPVAEVDTQVVILIILALVT